MSEVCHARTSNAFIGLTLIVTSILEVCNGGLCHFCFGLKTTQVEKSPVELVVNFNPHGRRSRTRKNMAHKKIVKRIGAITHPCFTPVRTMKCSVSVPLMRTVFVILSWSSLRIDKMTAIVLINATNITLLAAQNVIQWRYGLNLGTKQRAPYVLSGLVRLDQSTRLMTSTTTGHR